MKEATRVPLDLEALELAALEPEALDLEALDLEALELEALQMQVMDRCSRMQVARLVVLACSPTPVTWYRTPGSTPRLRRGGCTNSFKYNRRYPGSRWTRTRARHLDPC
jgi:hypothetical protein